MRIHSMLYLNRKDPATGEYPEMPLTDALEIPVIPTRYLEGIDLDQDEQIEPHERLHFGEWVNENVPEDWTGPVCLDKEGKFWRELMRRIISPARLRSIIRQYNHELGIAEEMRPKARWGFWGLPLMRHMTPYWDRWNIGIEPITKSCDAIFPHIYDYRPGRNDVDRWTKYLEWCITTTGTGTMVIPGICPLYPKAVNGEFEYVPRREMQDAITAMANVGIDDFYVWSSYSGHMLSNRKEESVDSVWAEYMEWLRDQTRRL